MPPVFLEAGETMFPPPTPFFCARRLGARVASRPAEPASGRDGERSVRWSAAQPRDVVGEGWVRDEHPGDAVGVVERAHGVERLRRRRRVELD